MRWIFASDTGDREGLGVGMRQGRAREMLHHSRVLFDEYRLHLLPCGAGIGKLGTVVVEASSSRTSIS